ncbi:Gfo/Idh/MocA family protein [Luteimicrobium subarcticum]|uniref:Putative dehydrogenase n=1 Tax=Luteimicrobium subarcticum TaxID=620910 RepID=A0A2M8WSN9_9MICO|nr:Gfo/Idh/MocA family oxidoreductase [Luteimicrobium subarcticum]PJI93904.1 putative dehydrogenase [Luteimicrobium subarcticum]
MSTDDVVLTAQAAADEAGIAPDPRSAPPVRWGILGAGGISGSFAEAVRRFTNGTVTAVGSRQRTKAESFASAHEIARAHGSYEDLVEDPDVDVVYVGTPHSHHHEHALLALSAGKPLLVEKAFTRNHTEALEVFDAARSADLFVMEAMWTRFLPHVLALREALAAGEIGEVKTFLGSYGARFPFDPSHRAYAPELAGGALLDIGVYPISFAHDLFGAPGNVSANGTLTETGVDGQAVVALDFADGVHAAISTTLWAWTPENITVGGTDGYVTTDRWTYGGGGFTVHAPDGEVRRRYEGFRGEGKQYQAAEVARCLDAGVTQSERMSWQDTLDVLRTLDEIRRQVGVVYPGEE